MTKSDTESINFLIYHTYTIYKTSNFIRNKENSIELLWNIKPLILCIPASVFVLLFCFMLIKNYFLSSCKKFISSMEESFSIVVVIELVESIMWLVLSKLFIEWSLHIGLPEYDCTLSVFSSELHLLPNSDSFFGYLFIDACSLPPTLLTKPLSTYKVINRIHLLCSRPEPLDRACN